MAHTHPLASAATLAEQHALAHLREHLPDAYTLFHGFDLRRGTSTAFVSLAILAPHALYLVDVKATRGVIDVYGPKWYPQGPSVTRNLRPV